MREDNERKCALSRRRPPGLEAALPPPPVSARGRRAAAAAAAAAAAEESSEESPDESAEAGRCFRMRGLFPAAAAKAAKDAKDAKDAKEEYTDFFCSELIAAALREMGAVSYDVADAHFWPGAFATGGSIEKYMADGFSYGDEIVIDCRIVEVSKARESPAQRAAASSKSGAAAALESSDCDSDAEEDPAVTRHALGMGAFKIS